MGHGMSSSSPGDTDRRRHATVPGVGPNRGDPGMTHGTAFWFHCSSAVLRRPRLWSTAIRQVSRTVPTRWWTRPPYVPVPDRAYVRFRFETAYGEDAGPRVADVVRYLEWCRATE
jgi:hypothetical protein